MLIRVLDNRILDNNKMIQLLIHHILWYPQLVKMGLNHLLQNTEANIIFTTERGSQNGVIRDPWPKNTSKRNLTQTNFLGVGMKLGLDPTTRPKAVLFRKIKKMRIKKMISSPIPMKNRWNGNLKKLKVRAKTRTEVAKLNLMKGKFKLMESPTTVKRKWNPMSLGTVRWKNPPRILLRTMLPTPSRTK